MTETNRKSTFSRREFLRLAVALGSISAVSTFLEACARVGLISPGDPTSKPQKTEAADVETIEEPTVTRRADHSATPEASPAPTEDTDVDAAPIAFIKTQDRAEGVRRAMKLLEIEAMDGKRVFVKPNFNSADPAPGSTHPEVLRAVVSALWGMGAAAITVGDRSGMGDTREVMKRLGVFDMQEELGFDTVVFDEMSAEEWEMIDTSGDHWYRGFPVARACLEADAVVQICCLKTHGFGGHFTMSLKNSVGMVAKRIPGESYDYMSALHRSEYQRQMIAEVNAAYNPALIVMDGVEAFVSGGPASGKRVSSEVVLAGTDRVAIDAVGVAVLRHFGTTRAVSEGPIFELEQIVRAVEMDLGVDGPTKINLVSEDAESAAYAAQIKEHLLSF